MKRVWMSVLSLLLAAAILVGGYFAIDFFDARMAPAPVVMQVEKDSETVAVWRFDNGEPLQLYPFDDMEEERLVEARYSREYLLAESWWMVGWQKKGEEADEEAFYRWANEWIYVPLLSRMLPEDADWPQQLPDMLGATKGQGTLYYLQEFPITFTQKGKSVTRLLTAAFVTDFFDLFQVYFLSFDPPADTPENEDEDLEELAATLNREYDRYGDTQWEAEAVDVEVDRWYYAGSDNVFAPILETIREVVWMNNRYDESAPEYFCTDIHKFNSRECVIYEDRLLFIAQNDTQRMVLLYSPALGEFYGFSLCANL